VGRDDQRLTVLNGNRRGGEAIMGSSEQGVERSRGRYLSIPRVLCFVTHGDEVLLLRGSPHKRLWAGRLNGLGGHLEPGEDIQAALLREIEEEAGIEVHDVRLRCAVHVDVGDPLQGVLFFVFTAVADSKATQPSREGELEWFPISALPTAEMVEDLPALLPKVLAMGSDTPPFYALYTYDAFDRLHMAFSEPK
jgi:8-oxo-dGTP diphosphatase